MRHHKTKELMSPTYNKSRMEAQRRYLAQHLAWREQILSDEKNKMRYGACDIIT